MLRRLSLVVLLAGLVAACQSSIETVLQRTPEDLDRLEADLTKYKLKPFPVSIDTEKSLVAGFELTSQAVCRADPYYAVETPGPSEQTSDANYAVSFAWRDAALETFRHGDIASALKYLESGRRSLPNSRGWRGYRGGVSLSESAFHALEGEATLSRSSFDTGVGIIRRSNHCPFAHNRARCNAWLVEGYALVSLSEGRYLEAEIRIREVLSKWSSEEMGSGTGAGGAPVRQHAMTNESLLNYALALSLVNQNRVKDAETHLRSVLWFAEDPIDLAWLLQGLSTVFLLEDRYEDAAWAAEVAADYFDRTCAPTDYFLVSRTYEALARSLTVLGRDAEAREWLAKAHPNLSASAITALGSEIMRTPPKGVAPEIWKTWSSKRTASLGN
jgi:tetratricopeptide (TPR) repeat protein